MLLQSKHILWNRRRGVMCEHLQQPFAAGCVLYGSSDKLRHWWIHLPLLCKHSISYACTSYAGPHAGPHAGAYSGSHTSPYAGSHSGSYPSSYAGPYSSAYSYWDLLPTFV
jgi:hypothetical protein